jgi:thioredoxin 1
MFHNYVRKIPQGIFSYQMAKKSKVVEESKNISKERVVREIIDSEFSPLVKENDVVVVDFFAEWCMPCVMMVPIIEELAKNLAGKVVFAKINVDENHETAAAYKIMSIPTLLIFKKGNLVDRITGALSLDMLKEKINCALKNE